MPAVRKLQKAPAYRFAAFALMALAHMLLYAGIQIIVSVGPELMDAVGADESGLSLLSSLGTLTMAILCFVSGALIARFGGKKVITAGLAVLTLSGALYLIAPPSFPLLCAVRLFQGVGNGMTSASESSLALCWFPRKERGTAHGLMGAFYGLAMSLVAVYAYRCTALRLAWNQTVGWMLFGVGALAALLVILFYRDIEKAYGVSVIDDAIEGAPETPQAAGDAGGEAGKPHNLREALHAASFWILASTLFFFCASEFGVNYVFPRFLDACRFSEAQSARIVSLGSLGAIVFSLAGGVAADRLFRSRRTQVTMIAFGGAAALFLFLALMAERLPVPALTALFFLAYGLLNAANGPAWCLPVEMAASEFAQQSVGTCLLFSSMGGFLVTASAGSVIQALGARAALLGMAGCQALVFAGALVIRKRYGR